MHMRRAAEEPDEGWAFDAPVVIDAVVAEIALFIEGEAAMVEPALRGEAFHRLVLIGFTKRLQHVVEDVLKLRFLIGGELGHRTAGELAVLTFEAHEFLGRHLLREERKRLMLGIEHTLKLVCLQRLMPEDVMRVMRLFV